MIVRDAGDAWQIVLQTDHADLSGQFARAWGNGDGFAEPSPFGSVVVATTRHDDGWAVWERAPGVDSDSRPRNFLDVQVPSHLAFYRAAIASVLDQDSYAGLLVSMHGAGIYRGRYGTQPSLKLTFAEQVKEQVEAFVAEQEELQQRLRGDLSVPADECWTNYKLLQVYDRLSLYFCQNDVEAGAPGTIEPVPVDHTGGEVVLELEPVEPWQVRIAPFPFPDSPAVFRLLRRILPKRRWSDGESFRRDFFAAEPELVELSLER